MAPQQQDVILANLATTNCNLKVITKVLELPLVSDTVASATALVSPYLEVGKPYLETILKHSGPALENIYSKADCAISDHIKTKMTSTIESLDSLACHGLEKITEKVPNLKDPECVEKAKVLGRTFLDGIMLPFIFNSNPQDSLLTPFHLTTEYLTSFAVSKIGLQLLQVLWLLPLLLLLLL